MLNRLAAAALLACVLVSASGAGARASSRYTLITILHTNDMHAQVMPPDQPGGLARAATLVRQIRSDMPNVVLLDAGDIIHGSLTDYLSGGRAIISSMNALGYDAAATGNHEYDFGLPTLSRAADLAAFPFLAANVHASGGGQWDRVEPYRILKAGGVRVAVLGLTTLETITLHWPGSIKDIQVEDPMATAAALVPELRRKADVVVVLSHLGDSQDAVLANSVPGIDFIVGGHSHTPILERRWVGDTLIAQAGANARALGRIDFIVRSAETGSRIVSVNGKHGSWSRLPRPALGKTYPDLAILPVLGDLQEDSAVRCAYLPFMRAADRCLAAVVGTAAKAIPGRAPGSDESPAGNLVADAVRAYSKSDIAIVDANSVSEAGLAKGPLTVGSALGLIGGFTRQQLVTCSVSGEDMKRMVEATLARKHAFTLALSGCSARYSKAGEVSLTVGEAQIDLKKQYTVASQSYIIMELMRVAPNARVVSETEQTTREALVEYFRAAGSVSPQEMGRVRRADSMP